MKSTTVPNRPRRSLPMPLWMQGFLELLLTAVFAYLAIVVILFAVWFAKGFDNRDVQGVTTLAGNLWSLVHGVPLDLDIPNHGVIAGVSGTMRYIPLGLTLIPLGLSFRSGRKLARASYEGQFWIPLVGGLVAYALFGAGISLYSANDMASTNPLAAALVPCWVVLLGVIGGGLYESKSLSGMIGVNAAESVRRFSQYSRWTGSYLWALVRASFIAPLALIAGGALLAGISIFYNWNDILAIYQELHAGAIGDTALTFLQLGILPNILIYAMSYSTGAGFALGEGSSINWDGANAGALPLLPILGSVPSLQVPWSYITVLVPLAAGVLAGWWFFREGEDHLDEWLSLKIRFRPVSWLLSHLVLAIAMGALSGIWVGLMGWAARGSLGLGKFTDVGPNPLIFAALSAGWIAIGIIAGGILGRLFEPDAKIALERESDAVLLAKEIAPAEGEKPARSRRFKLPRRKKQAPASEEAAAEEAGAENVAPGENELVAGAETEKDSAGQVVSIRAKKKPRKTRSASVGALQTILGDEEAEVPAEQAPAEEKPETVEESAPTETAEVPADAKPQAEEESATDKPEQVEPAKTKTPRLSRGTVIRRPKAHKKTDKS